MTTVLVIDKTGIIKEVSIKNYDEKTLYKKAGLKIDTDFKCQHTFEINKDYSISVFGRIIGKSNYVNKYDFPPPIDNTLFFGSCILVRNDILKNTPIDLNTKLWNVLYSELFGGFEDIENSDSDSDSDSDEDVEPSSLTKEGYLKDDFVTEDTDESVDSSTEEKLIKKNNAKKRKPTKPTKSAKPTNEESYLDCPSELCAEEYFK